MNAHSLQVYGAQAHVFKHMALAKWSKKPGEGMDLCPSFQHFNEITLTDYGYCTIWSVPTEVHLIPVTGTRLLIKDRSSTVAKLMGCSIIYDLIDPGYTGEIRIRFSVPNIFCDSPNRRKAMENQLYDVLHNCNTSRTAIAQVLLLEASHISLEMIEELPLTERGAQGFGSTDQQRRTGT